MGDTIKTHIWVEVHIGDNEAKDLMVWTTPPLHETGRGIKRYQVNFEVPKFEVMVTEELDAAEVIELPDGNGVLVRT